MSHSASLDPPVSLEPPVNLEPSVNLDPPAPEATTVAPRPAGRATTVAKVLAGLAIYLLVTALSLRLAWLVPGRGVETLTVRTLLGCWLPGIAALGVLPWLRSQRQGALAAGLLIGMGLVGVALAGLAFGIGKALRVY